MTDAETPARIEPCHITEAGGELLDLVADLPELAAGLGGGLRPESQLQLASLVRVMNCYYSNLIEGHNTRPRDIERALSNDLDPDERRRDLQIEARAHIRVQAMIEDMHRDGRLPPPASPDFLCWLHREFYRDAPESMLWIDGAEGRFRMVPGEFRSRSNHEVAVGRHLPPSSAAIPDFMTAFGERYRFDRLGKGARILAIASAHHRLNFIHPFPDGNGRVSRLMSHAMVLEAGIGAHGLWSISRGLARGLSSRGEYKSMMDMADMPRQGDRDGRGNLSLKALTEFSVWFLRVARDQIAFMGQLFELAGLAERLRKYAELKGWRPEAGVLLIEILYRGEIARGDARQISGLGERTARDLLGVLVDDGILGSETPKGPVSLRFPVASLDVLFPRLFLEA